MSDVYPALRGKMGCTEYFVLTVKARALTGLVTFQTEDDRWENLTMEERDQRDINISRIRNQIAPYLRNDPFHFMGAVVLQADKLADDCFDPLIGKGALAPDSVIRPYRDSAKQFGFLNLTGGEVLRPLDGQHRLKALDFAIRGLDDQGKQLPPTPPPASSASESAKKSKNVASPSQPASEGSAEVLANEDVTVIVVRANLERARKIFTDINSYAKPTTTGDNLITNDSESHAVLSRRIANELIWARLVKYKSNNLADSDCEFTTLSTISKGVKAILKALFEKRYDKYPTSQIDRDLLWGETEKIWSALLQGIEIWNDALHDRKVSGDMKRKDLRRQQLCLRPVPQQCILEAYVFVTLLAEHRIGLAQAIKLLNAIPWDTDSKLWDRVLWAGGKVQTKNAKLVTDLLKYMMLGDKYGEKATKDLLERYKQAFPPKMQIDPKFKLPVPVNQT